MAFRTVAKLIPHWPPAAALRQGAVLWLLCWTCILSSGQSMATEPPPGQTPSPNSISSSSSIADRLDAEQFVETIRSGRVYQFDNFLTPAELEWLRNDLQTLRSTTNAFAPSGLSDTSRGNSRQQQGFSQRRDRSVSPVPWWKDALSLVAHQEQDSNSHAPVPSPSTSTATTGHNPVARRLHELRHWLADALDRPGLHDPKLAHECYYSIAGPGSSLPRHMDDKHEEFKGAKGWLQPSRRSLAWLIYLSEQPSDWNLKQHGGALRTFPPRRVARPLREPTHAGNLQVAWLLPHDEQEESDQEDGARPVYLDSWYRSLSSDENDNGTQYDAAHAILYTLDRHDGQPIYLTRPWRLDHLPPNVALADFVQQVVAHDAAIDPQNVKDAAILFLHSADAQNFCLLEDRALWDAGKPPASSVVHDIVPRPNSLVIFDAVLLPHQVEVVRDGVERMALAGWFHEPTQAMPE